MFIYSDIFTRTESIDNDGNQLASRLRVAAAPRAAAAAAARRRSGASTLKPPADPPAPADPGEAPSFPGGGRDFMVPRERLPWESESAVQGLEVGPDY